MKKIALGDAVFLRGVVVSSNLDESRPVEMQSLTIQLSDGQGVHTNIRNIVDDPEPEAEAESAAPAKPKRTTKKTEPEA